MTQSKHNGSSSVQADGQPSASNSMAEHSYERRTKEDQAKKDSFFGIDTEERIEKFLSKF